MGVKTDGDCCCMMRRCSEDEKHAILLYYESGQPKMAKNGCCLLKMCVVE